MATHSHTLPICTEENITYIFKYIKEINGLVFYGLFKPYIRVNYLGTIHLVTFAKLEMAYKKKNFQVFCCQTL